MASAAASSPATFSTAARINRGYSFNSHSFDINGSYRFDQVARLSFGYKRKDMERSLQQIENSVEDTYWAEISYFPHMFKRT